MLLTLCLLSATPSALSPGVPGEERVLHVDPARGREGAPGTERKPMRSISEALAQLEEPLTGDVRIRLAEGRYTSTGGVGMPGDSLQLDVRMRPGVRVRLEGPADGRAVLAWTGERRMIEATAGSWILERLMIGTFESQQIRGVYAHGPVTVSLRDVRFELRSRSDAAVWAERGARVALTGDIRVNDLDWDDGPPEDGYSGLVATDCGVIEFEDGSRSTLLLGNGSLRTSYWGSIRLGCREALLTCHTRSNVLSIGNSGRIDLRNTRTTLVASDPRNTPIGLEHDGHVLGEDAEIHILGDNHSAIALQKASTLTCNDIYLEGTFETALWATSGSMFVGRFKTDVGGLSARTGSTVNVEKIDGEVKGPVEVSGGGLISLPDRVVR
jgi:hypothetical protein